MSWMPSTRRPLQVRIRRSSDHSQERFEVERFPAMTVLDVLLASSASTTRPIGFRFSCRVAMCGTCTLRVDGRSVLACQALVAGPRPRDRDRARWRASRRPRPVVDMAPFWEQWARVTPYLSPKESLTEPADGASRLRGAARPSTPRWTASSAAPASPAAASPASTRRSWGRPRSPAPWCWSTTPGTRPGANVSTSCPARTAPIAAT